MKASINKSKLNGKVKVIGSKSYAHRYLIAEFLSFDKGYISNVPNSNDIKATLSCLKSLGANYKEEKDIVYFEKTNLINKTPIFNCEESGSTLRFLIPISLAMCDKSIFMGSPRLIERGIGIYEDLFKNRNINLLKSNNSITLNGRLTSGIYEVDGSISSQFITGLLFALPLVDGDSEIRLIPPVNSKNYIDITISVLKEFGIEITVSNNSLFIKGNQKFKCRNLEVEGDYSNAAFIDAFNYFNSSIEIEGLNPNSLQGDKAYIKYFKNLDKEYSHVDVANCIDLAPALMVFAALKHGGHFINTNRLSIKESNRGEAIKEELSKIGANIEIGDNYIDINEQELLFNNKITFDSHNDHRIAMAISLLISKMNLKINDYEAINKSYPEYFKILEELGAEVSYE